MTPRAVNGGRAIVLLGAAVVAIDVARGQIPPTDAEIARYAGLHAAVAIGDRSAATAELDRGADVNASDGNGRTALHLAAFLGRAEIARLLLARGADAKALDRQRYDVVTIAGVRDDAAMIRIALAGGADPRAVTSPYDGTALIAAAHLGHVEPVRLLIEAGAPLDHVNNLGWTALIEAIVLGDGGPRHTEIVRLLVAAGANVNIADRDGATPLRLAERRGYRAMIEAIAAAGAK